MSNREQRSFLSRELIQAEHFLQMVGDDPLMGPQFQQRTARLRSELDALPESRQEARTVLFFSGKPVAGSRAIDAQFVSEALGPFLEIVKSQYAASKNGSVGERGPRRDEDEARLMLSGTPRGSFGLELTAPPCDDLFAEERLSEVMVQVTRLFEAASASDDDYLLALDDIHERALVNVPKFFDVLKISGSALRIQTGDIELELSEDQIFSAVERLAKSTAEEDEVVLKGVFRGATLDKWRFDFRPSNGDAISGRISPERTEDEVVEWLKLTNQATLATVKRTIRTAPGGAMRRSYTLLDVSIL